MKQHDITLANALTYSGTLPLIGSVITLYFPVAGLDGALIASTYSAVIISFLCGIHWATYLFFAERCPRNLLITSNIVALLAWGFIAGHKPADHNGLAGSVLFVSVRSGFKAARCRDIG